MILREFPLEVLLSSAYALFLLAVAAALQILAKHSQRRTDQYELAGFRYHAGFDRWECPEGNHLVLVESDPVRRTARYRAQPHDCNVCTRKRDCTNSDSGREIEYDLDVWLRTGLGQFHRGLSLALIVLAGSLLTIEASRHPEAHTITLLGILFLAAAFCGVKVVSPFRRNEEATFRNGKKDLPARIPHDFPFGRRALKLPERKAR